MKGKGPQSEFDRLERLLEAAIQQLTEGPHEFDHWRQTLQSAGGVLDTLREQMLSPANDHAQRLALERIRIRVDKVRLLLDSAVTFYCGCVALVNPSAGGYTQEGTKEHLTSFARMQLEA